MFSLSEFLKDSEYKLGLFEASEIKVFEKSVVLKTQKDKEVPYTNCIIRKKEIKLTPEEVVRQLFLNRLLSVYKYPASRITLEHPVKFGTETKRADIVIFDKARPTVEYLIVELKKPKLKDGKEQLKSYCNATGAPIGVWTNGDAHSFYHRKDPNYFEEITEIPNATQSLNDVLNERFTIKDLIMKDRLKEKSLKEIIEELEDEVLANAGVDVFEEAFKLIFIKLYDEYKSGKDKNKILVLLEDGKKLEKIDDSKFRNMEFRSSGTEAEVKAKIDKLFDEAKTQWQGIFSEDAKINLQYSPLSVCVSYLQNIKLFNSNLEVVDEAFEYLVNKSAKGEKGQYFTPRYVIDMCVKMLNPKPEEYMIDTASGSCGFPMHTIFDVWQKQAPEKMNLFTTDERTHEQTDYVQNKVFAIDFDDKAVRVGRLLNLIAGDGQTNVLHLNSLDYDRWDENMKNDDWQSTYSAGFNKLKKLSASKESYKEFKFDILMANPPFAGDIKDGRIIHKYELAKKPTKGWQDKVSRDILFIERNLNMLKPGGRMAIVLPQGRFNNSSDKVIRDYIAAQCRILGVVGLHQNTFKPHTGTKTSVLLVQKWDNKICPRQDDYNIFFATQSKPAKDNSGEKIYLRDAEGNIKYDIHGHRVVVHDLYNHENLLGDGIAEAFAEFAKKERLSFF